MAVAVFHVGAVVIAVVFDPVVAGDDADLMFVQEFPVLAVSVDAQHNLAI